MKVFLTGATGYIGYSVALAFRRAGHEVYGLVRTDEKARLLAKNEIHPIVGNMQSPQSYLPAAEQCSVLIHAAFDVQGESPKTDRQAVAALLSTAGKGAQPKTFLFTSGVWVYGNTGIGMADETTALNPPAHVAWRPANEQIVLNAEGMRGLVIRPGCLYGLQGGLTGEWFQAAYDKTLKVVGDGKNRWAMVHPDDLADGYLRAAESGLGGEIFNFTDRSRASVRDMAQAVARVTHYSAEIQYTPVAGAYHECLALDQHVDSRKAVRLLGWQPKHSGFIDGVEAYFASWKAHQ